MRKVMLLLLLVLCIGMVSALDSDINYPADGSSFVSGSVSSVILDWNNYEDNVTYLYLDEGNSVFNLTPFYQQTYGSNFQNASGSFGSGVWYDYFHDRIWASSFQEFSGETNSYTGLFFTWGGYYNSGFQWFAHTQDPSNGNIILTRFNESSDGFDENVSVFRSDGFWLYDVTPTLNASQTGVQSISANGTHFVAGVTNNASGWDLNTYDHSWNLVSSVNLVHGIPSLCYAEDSLFIPDWTTSMIYEYYLNGTLKRNFTTPSSNDFNDCAIDWSEGILYVGSDIDGVGLQIYVEEYSDINILPFMDSGQNDYSIIVSNGTNNVSSNQISLNYNAPNLTITNDDFELNSTDSIALGFEDAWLDNIINAWIVVNGSETQLSSNKMQYMFNYTDTIGYTDGILRDGTPYLFSNSAVAFYEYDEELNYVGAYGGSFDNIGFSYGIAYDDDNDRIIAGYLSQTTLKCEYWNGTDCSDISTDLPNVEKWSLAKLGDYWYVVDGSTGFVYQFNETWNFTGLSFDFSNGGSQPTYQIEATEDSLLVPDYANLVIREYDEDLNFIGTYSTISRDYDAPFYTGKYVVLNGAQISIFPPEMSVLSAHNFTANLTDYLAIGNNSVQVKIETDLGNFTSDIVYFNVIDNSPTIVYPELDPTLNIANETFIPFGQNFWVDYNNSQDINSLTWYLNNASTTITGYARGDRISNLYIINFNGYNFWYSFYDDTHDEICWTGENGVTCSDENLQNVASKTLDNCNTPNGECRGMFWDSYLERYLWIDLNETTRIESNNYDGSYNTSINPSNYTGTNHGYRTYLAGDGNGKYFILDLNGVIFIMNSSFYVVSNFTPQEVFDDGQTTKQILYKDGELVVHANGGTNLYFYDTDGNFFRRESMDADFYNYAPSGDGSIVFDTHGHVYYNRASRILGSAYDEFPDILLNSAYTNYFTTGDNTLLLSMNNEINDTNSSELTLYYRFTTGDAPTLSVSTPTGLYAMTNVPLSLTTNKNSSEVFKLLYSINGQDNKSALITDFIHQAPVSRRDYFSYDPINEYYYTLDAGFDNYDKLDSDGNILETIDFQTDMGANEAQDLTPDTDGTWWIVGYSNKLYHYDASFNLIESFDTTESPFNGDLIILPDEKIGIAPVFTSSTSGVTLIYLYDRYDGSYLGNLTFEDNVRSIVYVDGYIYGVLNDNLIAEFSYNGTYASLTGNYVPTLYDSLWALGKDNTSEVLYFGGISTNPTGEIFRWNGDVYEDSDNIYDTIPALDSSNSITYYLEDWAGRTATDTGSFSVSTTFAPQMQNVYITPSTLIPQSDLVGNCIATDNDGGTLDYNYNWYKNGVLYDNGGQNGVAEGTIFSTSLGVTLVAGDVWKFSCQATDGTTSTGFVDSLSKTIQPNTAPSVTPNIVTPVFDTGTLTARCLVNDINGDASTITWRIYRDTILIDGGTYNNVASGTNKVVTTITSDDLLFGQQWIVECNAYDGFDNSGFSNSSVVTITKDDQPPIISYVRLYPVVVANDSSITISVKSTDANGDILNYSVGLVVNDALFEGGALYNISSGSEANYTFTLSSFNESDTIKVNASVTDGSNVDTGESLTFVVHTANNAPVVNSVSYSPELFLGSDDNVLGYCNATDADGDYIIYDYIWYIDNVAVRSGTKSYSYIGSASGTQVLVDTLPNSQTSEGDDIILSCRGYDTIDYGAYVNGSTISVFEDNNFAPQMVTSLIYGGTATTDTLYINASATDNDGQDVRFTYQIVKNGQLQTAVNTAYFTEGVTHTIANISPSETTGSDTFYVRIRAYDGNTLSDWKNSNTITIENTPPNVLNATISQIPYENTTLIGICNANDVDDDTLTFDYIWYNGSLAFTTQKNLLYNYTQQGQTWTLSCRAYDGSDYSSYVNSTGISILDSSTIPEIQSVGIIGRSANITGTCLANDYDGDLVDYAYRWYKNGALDSSSATSDVTQGVTQSVLITPAINIGDSWIFSCKASDDLDGSSAWTNSSAMLVPTELFGSYVEKTTSSSIEVRWNSNADSFVLYLDGSLVTTTSAFKYTFTGLLPATTYNISIQPIKNNYYYALDDFSQATKVSDNNNPTMTSVELTNTAYTDTTLSGRCKGTDIESASIFYTYTWYVNDSVVASGVTALATRDTFVNIPTISTSLYDYNDSVTLVCEANDGLGTSASLNDSVTILNSEPVLSDVFVDINGSQYICIYEYSDADNDTELFDDYTWYLNDVSYGVSGIAVNVSDFAGGDELICQVNTGDGFYNISENSSNYIVGDFGAPTLSDISYPNSVVFGQTAEIRASCVDDNGVAIGYPVVRFTNPNLVEQEYQLFFDADNSYVRYLTLPILGTYRDFEFECRDGNGNRDIVQSAETLLLLDRETIVNVGGGGAGGEPVEPFRELESFTIDPAIQDVFISAGSTLAVEFEIENTDIVDIPFTIGIGRNNDTPETYGWMSFADGSKGVSFVLDKSGGLDDNTRFVRYTISVPDDVEDGEYVGQINIAGQIGSETQEGTYFVRINVGGGFFANLFATLNRPLFEIPLTATITGAVTGVETAEVDGVNATPLGIIIFLSAGGLIWYLIRRALR